MLFFASVFVQGAFADELKVGDLNYFQPKNSFLLDTSLRYETGKANEDTKTSATVFSNRFNYGIKDNYNVGIALDYAFTSTTEPDGGDETKNPGISDVVINNNIRLYNKDIYFDVVADLTISTGDQEVGNADDEGSYNNGANGLALAAIVGGWQARNQWRTGLRLDYFDEKYYTELADDSLEKYLDSALDVSLFANYQIRASEKFSLIAGLEFKMVGERNYEKEIQNSGVQDSTLVEDSHLTTKLSLVSLYNLSQSVTLKFGISHVLNHSYDTTYEQTTGATQPVIDSEVEGVNNTSISLAGIFLF